MRLNGLSIIERIGRLQASGDDVRKCCGLVRERLALFHHANLVIRKLGVPAGKWDLRHMTGHALRFRHRANFGVSTGLRSHLLRRSSVTSQTFGVIACVLPHNVLMRIVTCQTADAGIGPIEALAVCQTVRLKSHVDRPSPAVSHYGFPCSMTLATEARDAFGGKLA